MDVPGLRSATSHFVGRRKPETGILTLFGVFFSAADRSRICPVVNDLFASGNVSTAKECSREKPLCLDFECEFDLEDGVSTPVPLAIEAHIVPCAYTFFEGGIDQAISEVHIFVYGEGESLVLDVILEENATFVTEHTTSTETVTIKKNITVMQQAEGIVFGVSGL